VDNHRSDREVYGMPDKSQRMYGEVLGAKGIWRGSDGENTANKSNLY